MTVRPLLPLLLGGMAVVGFSPFSLYPLTLLALAGLFYLWRHAPSARSAALDGFIFGLGLFGAGVSWVYVSLHDFGGMPMLAAIAFTALFCAVLSLFPAMVGLIQGMTAPAKRNTAHLILLLPSLWALSEWMRGWVLTGFPWLTLGYSQVPDSPLAGFAPLLGVFGISHMLAILAGLLVLALNESSRKLAVIGIIALCLAGFALKQINWVTPYGSPISVSLLQGNIPQDMKWIPGKARTTLDTYAKLAQDSKGRLIVLPETALPLFLGDIPPDYLEKLKNIAIQRNGDLIAGIPEETLEKTQSAEYFNSALSYGASPTQVYRKYHLVPFGEYLPLRPVFSWILEILHIPLSDFSRGAETQLPMSVVGQRLALDICYEDAFGEEIIRQLPSATMLANLTNDAWFGNSHGPWQHLQMAQMRALETGRSLLRATNTGVTAIIGPDGKILRQAPVFTTATLEGTVQGYEGSTPFVRFGNTPSLLLIACGLLLAWKLKSQ
ncbi:MAG: apolipoprotein N-acyltransferase [Sulfuricellaceae bacterium]|nr:apolipoprotein N-acyltransferase [Sulfuricellaceae bacterium]